MPPPETPRVFLKNFLAVMVLNGSSSMECRDGKNSSIIHRTTSNPSAAPPVPTKADITDGETVDILFGKRMEKIKKK